MAAHVFVGDVAAPVLGDEDRHHLERVLRLRPGERVTVADGRGGWRLCAFGPGDSLEPTGPVEVRRPPSVPITIAFALTKGAKPEIVVQKLTELGIDRIVPFVAAHSVARWDNERAGRHLERLRKVAREAAMQSRRAFLPLVEDVTDFAGVVGRPEAVLADAGGEPPTLARPMVLVGPEGGWSDEEREAARATVTLGRQVLRSETAAIAAGAFLAGLRAGIVDHARSLPLPP